MKHSLLSSLCSRCRIERGGGLGGREKGRGIGELTFSSVAEKTSRCREVILKVEDTLSVVAYLPCGEVAVSGGSTVVALERVNIKSV